MQLILGDQLSTDRTLSKKGASHISTAKDYPRIVIFLIGMSMMGTFIVLLGSLLLGNPMVSQGVYDHLIQNLDVPRISMHQILYKKAEAGEDMCAAYIQNCFTVKIEVPTKLAVESLDTKLSILGDELCVIVLGFPKDGPGMEEYKSRV